MEKELACIEKTNTRVREDAECKLSLRNVVLVQCESGRRNVFRKSGHDT